MNITITIDKDSAPARTEKKFIPIEDRIDYAIECMYCDIKKDQAIAFLQKAHTYLDALPRQDVKTQVLLEKVAAAITRYGHYLLPDKASEKNK